MDARSAIHLRVRLDRRLNEMDRLYTDSSGTFVVEVNEGHTEFSVVLQASISNLIQIQAELLAIIPDESVILRIPVGIDYWKLDVYVSNQGSAGDSETEPVTAKPLPPALPSETSQTVEQPSAQETSSETEKEEADPATFHPDLFQLDLELKELLAQQLVGGNLILLVGQDEVGAPALFLHPIRDIREAINLFAIIADRYPSFVAAGLLFIEPDAPESPEDSEQQAHEQTQEAYWILRMMQ